MKNGLLLLLCLVAFNTSTHAQTEAQIDSLTLEMCKTLNANENLIDSVRIASSFEKHLPGFFKQHKVTTDEQFKTVYNKIYYRYQKNCPLLHQMLSNIKKTNGEWKAITAKPKITITKKQCRDLSILKNFYYKEPSNGSNTKVVIGDGYWTEEFADGTYSKLYFKWISDFELEIEFIESNNLSRKNFSNKGDKYQYGVFNRKGNDFELWVSDANGKPVQTFWMHARK